MTAQDIIGIRIVGFRYGAAPEDGRSYNSREREYEPGVSMASVGYLKEVGSFAVDAYDTKDRHFYVGTVAGFGGDNEVCLVDCEEISEEEYVLLLPKYVEQSNMIVDCYADRWISLMNRGFDLGGKTHADVEEFRRKNKR